ncbi:MAG: tetratricopeptide repeat protein [Luteolibacter sp.]
MNPRIFISSVSSEFRSIRQQVATVARQLGYETVTMDDWPIGHGELRAWLRKEIDSCEGLIHIPGMAYGAEPEEPGAGGQGIPEEFTRYSYTQYEFLYAQATGKKTWVITPGAKCSRDTPPDRLDYPTESATADPVAYQAERRQLQEKWIAYLTSRNFIRHQPEDDKDLKLIIHTLRDHAEEMRGQFSEWQGFISASIVSFEKRQKTIRNLVIAAIVLLAIAVPLLFFVKKDTSRISAEQKEIRDEVSTGNAALATRMSEMQEALSRIQQQTDPEQDPISSWPKERLEEALASRMGISGENLRKLLAEGKTSVDGLVQAQALLGSGETEAAEGKFDEIIAMEAQAQEEKDKRLFEAYSGKAQIAFDKVDFRSALDFREKAAALLDKETDPLGWADAQADVTFVHLQLAMYAEAEPLLREILRINKQERGTTSTETAAALSKLAQLLHETNRHAEAEPLMRRALEIDEAALGKDHPSVAGDLNNLGQLLRATDRMEEAEKLIRRALEIDEAALGKDHPDVSIRLNNLASLLHATGRFDEAEPLMRRALDIVEAAYGRKHPNVAIRLNNLAILLQDTGRMGEAEPLLRRALDIDEAAYGKDHPAVGTRLNNLALLLQNTGRLSEAEPLMQRQVGIFFLFLAKAGHRHPYTLTAMRNYVYLAVLSGHTTEEIITIIHTEREKAGLPLDAFTEMWAEVMADN